MQIDYDGINHAVSSIMDRAERQMYEELQDAMRDGTVTACRIESRREICDDCRGEGHNSRHLGVFDRETIDEMDEEQWEWYRSGVYDRPCSACGGSGKVREIDTDAMPDDVRQWIEQYQNDTYNHAMERRAEWMMGA